MQGRVIVFLIRCQVHLIVLDIILALAIILGALTVVVFVVRILGSLWWQLSIITVMV